MSFSSNAVSLASRLIKKFGKTVTYVAVTQSAYDPSTGTAGTVEVSKTIKALVEDYRHGGEEFVLGLVLEGDKKVTAPAASFATPPSLGDRIIFDTFNMTVKNVKTLFAGEIAATYELHVRN